MSTVSDEGISVINASTNLVLRQRRDQAVEFHNSANRLYVLQFVHVADISGHNVLYFMLRLAGGMRGGLPDKDTGRMVVAVIVRYLVEHPDDLVCYCHFDNPLSNALNRIFHNWASHNHDLLDESGVSFFDGTGHDKRKLGFHFMVAHKKECKDMSLLKEYIQENSDDFGTVLREQISILNDIEKKNRDGND